MGGFNLANFLVCALSLVGTQTPANAQFSREVERHVKNIQHYWRQFLAPTPPYRTTSRPIVTTPAVTTALPLESNAGVNGYSSPHAILASIITAKGGQCGARTSAYLPHLPNVKSIDPRVPRRRRGRIVWARNDTMGSSPAPQGTFPWMASLFVLYRSGEALFMCAASIVTPNLLLTAAHCFTTNKREDTWFARVGDNYILSPDPHEQTFRVRKIITHELFDPLREDGGDGRNDIALVSLYPHRDGSLIKYSQDVRPICFPQPDYPLAKLYEEHCEIAGWGMTEYNNTSSYPDSVRAARIQVGDIPKTYCDYLYQRDVSLTGKFCAGGQVDACQEDSGGPLVCRLDNGRYHVMGIVSSGKGCGVYPGLYTEVSRYIDWLAFWVQKETI